MKEYLATLHQRSPEHKHRFALLASLGFTLVIFAFWAFFTLSPKEQEVVTKDGKRVVEVSPLSPIINGVAAAWAGFTGDFSNVKEGLTSTNTNGGK